jgi:hypothetical protein
MRRALMLLISLAVFGSTAALGAVPADAARDAARSAHDRNVQSARRGQPEPGTTSQAHAALRERMLGLMHRPATVAAVPARRAATVRSAIHTGLGTGGTRPVGYRAVPGHGALGGPTLTRSSAKVRSGVPRRPL